MNILWKWVTIQIICVYVGAFITNANNESSVINSFVAFGPFLC